MYSRFNHYFIVSTAALLAAFATVLFVSNFANAGLTQPHDPLTAMRMDVFFWILGSVAMAVVLACIFIGQSRFKLVIILWFAVNLIIYRLGLQWQGIHDPRGYFGGLARAFNLSESSANMLSSLLFLYLFIGSAALLLWDFLAGRGEIPLKSVCVHCGGHVAFSPQNIGQKIACPHCQKNITLQAPGNLKMSCFFCHGHIEFPAHALGQKIKCPHCHNDITLKEQANI